MGKAILYSIGNRDKYNFYILNKKNEAITPLFNSLSKIFGCGFNEYEDYKTKEGKWDLRKIDYEKLTDEHFSDTSNESKIDIFLGSKKIFLTIICSLPKRDEFNNELFKFADMVKPKETKKTNLKK
jgi:hypothetical protein